MNREKKQLVVIGVLVVLVLSVGAFQFTRKDPPPPPAAAKESAKVKKDADKPVVPDKKYVDLLDLAPKDPFEIASFVSGPKAPVVVPPIEKTTVPGTDLNTPAKVKIEGTLLNTGGATELPPGGGPIVPYVPPVIPVFGYSLVGIVEGAHPMAVFEDGKGNQRLVEAGQSLGSTASVLSISRGKVRVKFNAETLVLNVGGNPNAK
jgi:hypothetical protein